MTALVQLGLMHEQGGQPGVDLLGARQTVDTLGLLADKTRGNLTMTEDNLLQNCLYELRMAYVEVTNAIARGPQAPGTPPPPERPSAVEGFIGFPDFCEGRSVCALQIAEGSQ